MTWTLDRFDGIQKDKIMEEAIIDILKKQKEAVALYGKNLLSNLSFDLPLDPIMNKPLPIGNKFIQAVFMTMDEFLREEIKEISDDKSDVPILGYKNIALIQACECMGKKRVIEDRLDPFRAFAYCDNSLCRIIVSSIHFNYNKISRFEDWVKRQEEEVNGFFSQDLYASGVEISSS